MFKPKLVVNNDGKALGKQLAKSEHSISNGAVAKLSGVPAHEIKDRSNDCDQPPEAWDFETAFDYVFAACEEIETLCQSMYAVARERKANGHEFCVHAREVSNALGVIQAKAHNAMKASETMLGGKK